MSPREGRSSESKRRRSRFHREPSPKRSRPETERPPAEPELGKARPDRDHQHHRPLETPLSRDSKVESGIMSKESEKGSYGHHRGIKHSPDPAKAPQSRSSYFQHDERGMLGKMGESSVGEKTERGWWTDPKEHQNDMAINKPASSNTHQNNEKAKDTNLENNHVWRHDGCSEIEPNPKPHARKRPSFREQRNPTDQEKIDKATKDQVMYNPQDHTRRNKRGQNSQRCDKPVRSFAGERQMNKAQGWGRNFTSSDRFTVGSRYKARQDYGSSRGRVEKWKHDLYNEANRSQTAKNEDDQISKIEELLAS